MEQIITPTLNRCTNPKRDLPEISSKQKFESHKDLKSELSIHGFLNSNIDLLERVLEFVGQGQFIYLASVCRQWRDSYQKLCKNVSLTKTKVSNAFDCPSKLRFGLERGLKLDYKYGDSGKGTVARIAGSWASIEVIESALEMGLPWYSSVAIGASISGRLDLLKWIHSQIYFGLSFPSLMDNGSIALYAAINDHDHILDWMWNSIGGNTLRDISIGEMAAMTGSIRVLNWMKQVELMTKSQLSKLGNVAAYFAQYRSLLWVRDEGLVLDSNTFVSAISGGDMKYLEWLFAQGCKWNLVSACYFAARKGRVEMLIWLRSISGDEWDENNLSIVLLMAGNQGNLPMFKWAIREGAGWYPAVFVNRPGCCRIFTMPVLEWAIRQGCPWGDWDSSLCAHLLKQGEKYTKELNWAHQNGCPCNCPRILYFD